MSLRSPLGRARGMGSAKDGMTHFWAQRLTAVALVPITFWFCFSLVSLAGADFAHFRAWLSQPGNMTLMLITIFITFHHAQLGMSVVLEDYVHDKGLLLISRTGVKFAAWLFGIFCAVAVLHVAFIGG